MTIHALARVQDLTPPAYRIPIGHTYESAFFQALERRMAELEGSSDIPYLKAFHGSLVFIIVMILKKARAPKSALDDATMLGQLTTGLFRSSAAGNSGKRPFTSELFPAVQLLALGAVQEHIDPIEAAARIAVRIEVAVGSLPTEALGGSQARERAIAFDAMTKQVFTPLLRQAFRWLADAKERHAVLKSLIRVRHESGELIRCYIDTNERVVDDFREVTSLDRLEGASSILALLDKGRQLRKDLDDQVFWGEFASHVPIAVIQLVDSLEYVSSIFLRSLCALALTDAGMDDWLLPRPFSAVLRGIRDRAAGLIAPKGTLLAEAVRNRYASVRMYVMTRIAKIARRGIPEGVEARIDADLRLKYDMLLEDVSTFVRNGEVFSREGSEGGLLYEPKPVVVRLRPPVEHREEELAEVRSPKLTMRRLEELFRFWIETHKDDMVVGLRHRAETGEHTDHLPIAAALFASAYHRLEAPWSEELEREYAWMLGAVAEVPMLLRAGDPPFPKPYAQLILAADTDASVDGQGAKYLAQLARLAESVFPKEVTNVGCDVADEWLSGHVSPIAHLLCFAHFGEGFYGADFRSIDPPALASAMIEESAWISLLPSEGSAKTVPKLRSKLHRLLMEVRDGSRLDASETSAPQRSTKKVSKKPKKTTKKRA